MMLLVLGFTWWLGLYVLARDVCQVWLRWAGYGLGLYALALAAYQLREVALPEQRGWLNGIFWLLLGLPLICWSNAVAWLLPETLAWSERWQRWSRWWLVIGSLPLLGFVILAWGARPGVGYWAWMVALIVVLAMLVISLWRSVWRGSFRRVVALLGCATLFLGLGVGLLALPLAWLPDTWLILALGGDMLALGWGIALFDALDSGSALAADLRRSFVSTLIPTAILGAHAVVIWAVTEPSLVISAALISLVMLGIAWNVLADPLSRWFDRLTLRPELEASRTQLREVAAALPKSAAQEQLLKLDDEQWFRVTRRVLSQYADLARLAASPLIHLPLITTRLAERGVADLPLERAVELQTILREHIELLKPQHANGCEFDTSDEWRFYNVLYFPYVRGVRPYRRANSMLDNNEYDQQALDWFNLHVPQRTMYNWQNAAAKIIAQNLQAAQNGLVKA